MIKVITYGTFDLLHRGHIRLLERAKALGDYLIVGVTADTFDLERGKINVQQSLMERIENVRATGLADQIIVEEYEGQKIDDIRRLGVDIFTVGSDWKGHFDYLKEYCKVVYLDRTEGVSSTELRAERGELRLGLLGSSPILKKFERESKYVNGLKISGISDNIDDLLDGCDAIYIISAPHRHQEEIEQALLRGKHVLCESPITIDVEQWKHLQQLAGERGLILMDSIKTAYSVAYARMCLLAKGGIIGDIVSVDATCTSLTNIETVHEQRLEDRWNSIGAWGPTALLPVFQLLGTGYVSKTILTNLRTDVPDYDNFTKIDFVYPHAVASLKVGQGVKSEGSLVVSGTKGYIYVPAPWWKTDYFEVRFENLADNKRYFYQLDGEGIRYELVVFQKSIERHRNLSYVSEKVSQQIVSILADFYQHRDVVKI